MTDAVLAVDLGGTKVEAALVAPEGTIVPGTRHRVATGPATDAASLDRALREVVGAAAADAPGPIGAVGIGAAGPIDREAGTISPVNMPRLRGAGLRTLVTDAASAAGLGAVPVLLGHDGQCLALAEAWTGATRGARASLAIVVSTGIGGGFVVGGRPLRGASGNAGHLGQTRGGEDLTLEEIASGPASVAWARSQGWTGDDGEQLGRDAAAGEPVARAAVERSAAAVGAALADAATLVDLDVIAVGGGFSRVSDDYVDLVGQALRRTAVLGYAASARVVRCALGGDAPLVGAGALALAHGGGLPQAG